MSRHAGLLESNVRADFVHLPAHWRIVDLVEITGNAKANFDDGDWIEAKDMAPSGVRLVQTGNIGIGKFLERGDRRFISEITSQRLNCKRLNVGDLLICRLAEPAGRACLLPVLEESEAVTSVDVSIVRPHEEDVDKRFLVQLFGMQAWLGAVSERCGGSTRSRIARMSLGRIRFAIPHSVAEQSAIADALADADSLIDLLEQLLTKKRQIKQGAMQELLTGQLRLPGFTDTWTDGVLGQVVAELVAGVSVNSSSTEVGAGVPSVVKTSAMKGGVFDPSECKSIVQADLARATTSLRKDTLLISRMNTPDLVGEVGYVDRDYDWLYLPDRVWMTRMRSSDCVCVRWLGYLLSSISYKRRISDAATGTSGSMKNIAKSALLGVPVSFPEFEEQRAIAQVLSDMDAEITALQSRLSKARSLKQAMAQSLLTGRIRLVPPTA